MFRKKEFLEILNKINSTYPSMTEFSKKSNLDRTYISKYINNKLDNPPSPEILKKISEASNGITSYYELMEICGYIDLSSVFLLNNGCETNLCLLNKEDLKDIGFSKNDIEQLIYLSNNRNIKDRYNAIANILNTYPENTLKTFYDKAFHQTKFIKEQSTNISTSEIIQKLVKLIEKSNFLLDDISDNDIFKKIGAVPLSSIKTVPIPILGTVKAGYNYLAQENIIDYVGFTLKKTDSENYYALNVVGDSMEPLFDDGDTVLVHKQDDFENGDNCVILINGNEATVKQVYKNENGIELKAINPYYPSKSFTKEEIKTIPVQIIGIVEKSIRNFKNK